MTTLASISPLQGAVRPSAFGVPVEGGAPPVGPPVGPPGAGPATPPPSPAFPPPGGDPVQTPVPSVPVPSRPPITNGAPGLVDDLTEAARLATRAVEMLATVPSNDIGAESTKDLRIRIFKTDMAAQSRLEKQIAARNPQDVLSDLRKADAYLEDANWQLAKKPSPDGRFNGVDIPGAMRDMTEGVRILQSLLQAATGAPAGGGGTPGLPPTPPTLPPAPGGGGGSPIDPPGGPGQRPPTTPPVTPPTTPPTTPPSGGDDSYPGEDEFPTDDKILRGGGGTGGGDS